MKWFLALTALSASASALTCDDSVKPKACISNTFHNVCSCRSQDLTDASQYKCAIMYENVPKKGGSGSRELTWLGGLPDALRKPSIKNSNDPELKASFGGIEAKSFWWRLDDENRCNPVQASAKCYAAMIDPSTRALDECAANIFNEKGKQTIGDSLCQNLKDINLVTPANAEKIRDINVGMYYSYCGSDWEKVESEGLALALSEPLCCQSQGDGFKFVRCNGEPFKKSSECN